jgi:hypothetical protein
MDADLFPSDLEVLLGSLTLLLHDEKETETRITNNMRDMEERFRTEVLPRHGIHVPDPCTTTDLVMSERHPVQSEIPPISQPVPEQQPTPEHQHPSDESPEMPWSGDGPEPSPLMKKLFKPIAIQCHPDKIKDAKKNRLFLLGRKAYTENDIPTVLFILSKLSCNVVLEDSELSEIRGLVEARRGAIHQKKDSLFYKWGLLGDDQKQHILNHIQILPKP